MTVWRAGLAATLSAMAAWDSVRGRRTEVDGQVLDGRMAAMLRIAAGARPGAGGGLEGIRAGLRTLAARMHGTPDGSVTARDLSAGGVPARVYAASQAGERVLPLLVFFHGGGFVMGDLDTHDALARRIAREAAVRVLSVAYRLAPEHPFPAAVEDALVAYRWARAATAALHVDGARIAVGGDSAGGNLAASVCGVTAGADPPCLQWLLYPAVDMAGDYESERLFATGFLLTKEGMDQIADQYVPAGQDRADPRLSPLRSAARGVPAVIVAAGFDPLRDQAAAYGAATVEAGLIHNFADFWPVVPAADRALVRALAALRESLGQITIW